ncbi:type VI secretion system ATPase TssH [Caldimonas thermodepolymerans]|jgi:type VI secretion ATPase, ClpV1 family|uniref:Type VI secretion system ATPase TssH n=1 Tax=Caldimonas thermodepolymerans TaxID=215580 RepID=A0A2S5T786_9BURK|nr:type VI secretion system ATPase TssH [Caldimonas thermodepolymerans]PPE70809.1 type VI secretion system ATPase TssH [Caldimonas thermodepolymerans]QPC33027.1 type VI secretion system ATPase TssH [Caldimonas thermodepolymerans]RDI03813.1 type VI secretion system protein VasG [Caldimonas thermodepolymerans]TCP09780.1 type VI secretion system protein VasG [Caldimonas thermodepolymerans]UZG45896.1 type VI secretion system ATPase TssH [Caldimonas thermodepolymerans]
MSEISRVALFGKLNSVAYKAVEGATVFCKLRGNPYVELEHWVAQIVQLPDSDWHRIIRHFGLDASVLAKDITAALDRLPRGATSISDLSDHVTNAVERGWVYGSLKYGESQVRTGHVMVGLLKTSFLRNALLAISRQFERIRPDDLAEDFGKIVAGSPEEGLAPTDGSSLSGGAAPGEASGALPAAQMGKQEALKRFTVDLTEQARSGRMDPIVGRDDEIRQVVDILMRRRQNNPILVGEAGVGKTAVVEGFAQRIVRGDVPPALKDVELRALDVGLLQAGASMKGEFEQRLRSVIEEVQASPKPIILFVDETHTLVGAGGQAGTGDAANLLKPALARGTLRTIGATTWAEYKKYIEKDPALTRRFQNVQVDEPDERRAILMMRGVASTMEKHHKVQILDEALEAAVRLSHRYIPARQLPDKAVSLLDTACARVAVSLHATPAEVDDSQRRIEALETELGIIAREQSIGIDTGQRRAECEAALAAERERLAALTQRWETEKGLVDRLLALRAQLRAGAQPVEGTGSALEAAAEGATESPLGEAERAALLQELRSVQAQLAEVQGENPLILPTVDYQAVASVVADWTGIPVGRMARNEIETVLNLPALLGQRVIGQDHAMEMIAKRIQTTRAGLDNPNKPIGVFLLAGTSGVGKTETALALAEALYGGEQNLVTINMSEFQEAHTVSTLKGAPPGYVGYGEGGVLTEAVRRKPYSVVLLDEVEKAHPDVHEIFFQVFDKGFMEDGEGRFIDFKNTLILLTTNAGTDLIASMCKDPELMPDPEALAKALREPLLKVFPPALLGRLVVIPYYPLSDEMLGRIVRLQLGRIKKRIEERHKVPFEYGEDVIRLVVSRCTESESGGRMIDAILTNTMLPDLSRAFLNAMMEGRQLERVKVDVQDGNFTYSF